jgi:hypothetical protein
VGVLDGFGVGVLDGFGVGDADLLGVTDGVGEVVGDADVVGVPVGLALAEVAGDGDGLLVASAAPGSPTMTARPAATPRASSLLMLLSFPRPAVVPRSAAPGGGAVAW